MCIYGPCVGLSAVRAALMTPADTLRSAAPRSREARQSEMSCIADAARLRLVRSNQSATDHQSASVSEICNAAHMEEVLEHTFEYIQLLKSPSGISEWIFNEVRARAPGCTVAGLAYLVHNSPCLVLDSFAT